jgi:hypothetical protein
MGGEKKKAAFQMEHNKTSGQDGFPLKFDLNFWEIIKTDMLELFSSLHARQVDLFHRLNFGEIILLPKVNEAERIQQHRPICLININFKIFMKTSAVRLNFVDDHVVH